MDIQQQLEALQAQLANLAQAATAQAQAIATTPAATTPAPAQSTELVSGAVARELDRDLGRSGTGKMTEQRIRRIMTEHAAKFPNGVGAPAPQAQAPQAQAPQAQAPQAQAPQAQAPAQQPGTRYDSPKSNRPQFTQVWAVHLPEFYANGAPAQYGPGVVVPVTKSDGTTVQARIHHVWVEPGLRTHHKPRIMALVVTEPK